MSSTIKLSPAILSDIVLLRETVNTAMVLAHSYSDKPVHEFERFATLADWHLPEMFDALRARVAAGNATISTFLTVFDNAANDFAAKHKVPVRHDCPAFLANILHRLRHHADVLPYVGTEIPTDAGSAPTLPPPRWLEREMCCVGLGSR